MTKPPKLIVHSHLLLASLVLHVAVVLQRLMVITSMEGFELIEAVNAGAGLIGVGGIIALVTFLLFAINKARKKVPKLVFICIIVFNIIIDLAGAICFGVFVGITNHKNAQVFASGCLISAGLIVILEGLTILLFAFMKAPGVNSYRPAVEDEDDIQEK